MDVIFLYLKRKAFVYLKRKDFLIFKKKEFTFLYLKNNTVWHKNRIRDHSLNLNLGSKTKVIGKCTLTVQFFN